MQDNSDETIETISDAKEIFFYHAGSLLSLDRDSKDRYNEYLSLNIPAETELEWRIELFNKFYDGIMNKRKLEDPLWYSYSILCDLVENIKSEVFLAKLLDVTNYLKKTLPVGDRIMISEIINGQVDENKSTGLIYLAFDLGNKDMAKKLIDLSIFYAEYVPKKNRDITRCQNAKNICLDIKNELFPSVYEKIKNKILRR